MKLDLICVGRIKERFYTQAVDEYAKRLSAWCTLNIVEVKDESTPALCSDAVTERILAAEGERIMAKLPDQTHLIVLDIDGKSFSSPALAGYLAERMNRGDGRFSFVIGGSLGLCKKIKERADLRLSFSALTFPHQLMRVVLLEQIYRCFKINANEPYHK